MILRKIEDIDLFIEKCEPIVGVFGSKQWLSIYGDKLSIIGIYKDEHQLIGGFYYLNSKKFGLTFIKLPPIRLIVAYFIVQKVKIHLQLTIFLKK